LSNQSTYYYDSDVTYMYRVYGAADMRSPIYYDLNDTSYYVDPASTSVLNALNLNTAGTALFRYLPPGTGTVSINAPFYWNASTGSINIAMIDNDTGGVVIDNEGVTVYGAGDTGGVFRVIDEDVWQSNGNNVANATCFYVTQGAVGGWGRGDWEFYGSARAPIFYDYNNTGYYLDPASNSVLNTIYQVGVYTRNSAGVGWLSGNYSSSETGSTTGAIYSIGGSYYPTSTSFNNMYGIGYCNANYISVGISGASGWGQYVNGGGVNRVWLGGETGQVISTGEHSGTIFYDYNNTGYYVDPNGASNMYEVYANNWFRTYGQTGLYSQSYAQHFYPLSNGRYWAITGNGSTDYGALLFKTNYESTIKGYVYWDTNGFGLLHGGGGWSVRGNLAGIGGQFYGSWFSDTDLRAPVFYDSDNTGYYLDPASSSSLYAPYAYYYRRQAAGYGYLDGGYGSQETGGTSGPIYTIGGSYVPGTTSLGNMYGVGYTIGSISGIGIVSNWGFYVASNGTARHFLDSDTGTGYSTGSYRAPLFYDYNNTGYYVDPASTSILNVLNCYGNVTAYYSSDIKFKENVRDIPNALETVESIGGKLFDWNDEYMEDHGGEDAYFLRKEDFGVIAQDVQKVFPVAVRTRPDGSLAVDYEKLSALAFAAVAELSNRVKSLEARI